MYLANSQLVYYHVVEVAVASVSASEIAVVRNVVEAGESDVEGRGRGGTDMELNGTKDVGTDCGMDHCDQAEDRYGVLVVAIEKTCGGEEPLRRG